MLIKVPIGTSRGELFYEVTSMHADFRRPEELLFPDAPSQSWSTLKFYFSRTLQSLQRVLANRPKMGDTFTLTSPNFKEGGHIPRKHTAEGTANKKDISPQLAWHNVPEGTESLALIVEDPDAPDPESPIVPWVHWIVVNIPPTLHGLPENFRVHGLDEGEIPKEHQGITEGYNDFKQPGYRGPAPPTHAAHRYVFTLYALDKSFEKLPNKITKPVLEDAMEGHILGEAKLTGMHGHERMSPRGTANFIPPRFPMTDLGTQQR